MKIDSETYQDKKATSICRLNVRHKRSNDGANKRSNYNYQLLIFDKKTRNTIIFIAKTSENCIREYIIALDLRFNHDPFDGDDAAKKIITKQTHGK